MKRQCHPTRRALIIHSANPNARNLPRWGAMRQSLTNAPGRAGRRGSSEGEALRMGVPGTVPEAHELNSARARPVLRFSQPAENILHFRPVPFIGTALCFSPRSGTSLTVALPSARKTQSCVALTLSPARKTMNTPLPICVLCPCQSASRGSSLFTHFNLPALHSRLIRCPGPFPSICNASR